MYAIYGNIYHQYTPNVSIYPSTMDPMGTLKNQKKPANETSNRLAASKGFTWSQGSSPMADMWRKYLASTDKNWRPTLWQFNSLRTGKWTIEILFNGDFQ